MRTVRWITFFLPAFAIAAMPLLAWAQEQSEEVVVTDTTDFTIPDGDATEVLTFIEKLANPQQQFTSDEELKVYLEGVSTAISDAADKVLAGEATERQLIDAIEWKIEALRIRGQLGDENSDKQTDEFLAGLKFDDQPEVEKAVKEIEQNRLAMQQQLELMTKIRQWGGLGAAEREEATNWLIKTIQSGGATGSHASMLMMFCDSLADSPDSELAKRALNELLPAFANSSDPGVLKRLPLLEGIGRRLNLMGNKFELSGTLLDGNEIDWASYQGKVVLVDYWATWCGPCRAEVPNILENYLKYHDKGFEVIGISLDEKRSDAEGYVTQTNIPWPTLFHEGSDQSGWQNPMAIKYGITGIPTAILINQEGKVVSLEARGPQLSEELEKLLGEPGSEQSAVDVSDGANQTAQRAGR